MTILTGKGNSCLFGLNQGILNMGRYNLKANFIASGRFKYYVVGSEKN